jgi:hypothetical protein
VKDAVAASFMAYRIARPRRPLTDIILKGGDVDNHIALSAEIQDTRELA